VPLTIPPATNYPSGINAAPSFSQDEPREGRKQIRVEIIWNTMGGADKCVSFDLDGTRSQSFSQVSTIKCDNSGCGADVTFIFPDTGETITVPAGAPLIVVPVYSNSKTFYVYAPNASPEDETRFIALNFYTSPTEVSASGSRSTLASANMNCLNAVSSVNLVAAGINGTLESLTWYYAQMFGFPNVQPNTSQGDFKLSDGAGTVFIAAYRVAAYFSATPNQYSVPLLNLYDLNVRFRNGLIVTFTPVASWGTGNLMLNAFAEYSQP
jgi:hypothetical protein